MVDVGELAQMLAARAPALAAELLPGGRKEGPEWRCGGLDGRRGQSLAVHLQGAKAGVWADFASGERGDALDLVAQALFGGDKREAIRWARSWLGLDGGDPARLQATRRAVAEQATRSADEDAAGRKRALALWLSGQASLRGTLAEAYLAGRGIRLEDLGRQPRALRYLAGCWCQERRREAPALLAAVVDPATGQHLATHRTYLGRRADGSVGKADIGAAKKVLGRYRGGIIPLARGASGKSLREAPAGELLCLSEGIEDGLTVALAKPAWRVAAMISVSNAHAVRLPSSIREIVIAGQLDAPGSPADRALRAAASHWLEEGRVVRLPVPPGWWRAQKVKDVNDLLQAAGAKEGAVNG